MADDAAKIVERWRKRVPPQVPREEVERVVEAYFPGAYDYPAGGSHFLIVRHEALRLAAQHGVASGIMGGTLTFSLVKGKHVRKYQIEALLEAIRVKEAYDKVKEEGK